MKWAWHWTTATSAFKHFTSSNLIQPSSPSYLLLSHAMGLHADLFWLLSLILGWKTRQLTRCGQAIEFWVCAQRCVRVDWLAWSSMMCFLASAAGGRLDCQDGGERGQEGDDAMLLGTNQLIENRDKA